MQRTARKRNIFDAVRARSRGLQRPTEAQHAAWKAPELLSRFGLSHVVRPHDGCVNTLHWNSRGTLLLSGSDDRVAAIYDLNRSKIVQRIQTRHFMNIFDAKFVPETGDEQVVTCAGDGQVRHFHRARAHDFRLLHEIDEFMLQAAFLPNDPNSFIAMGACSTVYAIDLRDDQPARELLTLENGTCAASLAFDPFHPDVFALGSDDVYTRIMDLRFLPGARHVPQTGDATRVVQRWRPVPQQRNVFSMFRSFSTGASGLEFSPTTPGELLLNYRCADMYLVNTLDYDGDSGGAQGNCSSKVVQTYGGRRNVQTFAKQAAFMHDGNYVVTGGDDGALHVWEKSSGKRLLRLRADHAIVNCVRFHPSLPLLASSGIDSSFKLWQLVEVPGSRRMKLDDGLQGPDSDADFDDGHADGGDSDDSDDSSGFEVHDVGTLLELANQCFEQRRFLQAILLLQAADGMEPDNPAVGELLGRVQEALASLSGDEDDSDSDESD